MQFIIELVIRLLTKMMEKKEYGKIAQEVLEKKGIKSVSEILKKYPKIANSLKNMKESKTLENTLKYIGKKANQNTWELLKRTLLESIRSIEHMLLPAEVKQLYWFYKDYATLENRDKLLETSFPHYSKLTKREQTVLNNVNMENTNWGKKADALLSKEQNIRELKAITKKLEQQAEVERKALYTAMYKELNTVLNDENKTFQEVKDWVGIAVKDEKMIKQIEKKISIKNENIVKIGTALNELNVDMTYKFFPIGTRAKKDIWLNHFSGLWTYNFQSKRLIGSIESQGKYTKLYHWQGSLDTRFTQVMQIEFGFIGNNNVIREPANSFHTTSINFDGFQRV